MSPTAVEGFVSLAVTRTATILFSFSRLSRRPHERRLYRFHQTILILSTFLSSWLGMQAVHEAGHVLGAWVTGGEVSKVVLHPFTISRTDLVHNPHPLVVVWAGPIFGCLMPLALWLVAVACRFPGSYWLRFFAGFCLLANGAYIGAGSYDRVGDCGEMLRHGSPMGLLWLFGAVTMPAGLVLWHRLGPCFGLGEARGRVSVIAAYSAVAALLVLAALGFVVDGQ